MVNRGAFIVFEGCDRSGKSTQASSLVNWVKTHLQLPAKLLKFPNRNSIITGSVLDKYLRWKVNLNDAAVHLLFSANRWEESSTILNDLRSGTTIVADRYAYSGVAFTAAKNIPGLDFYWCKGADKGLPQPDLIIFLDLEPTVFQNRTSFGVERYEKYEFQSKVRQIYFQLQDEKWMLINATQNVKVIEKEIREKVEPLLTSVLDKSVVFLWDDL